MLRLDEMLDEAAGPIDPTFDLDDIVRNGESKVRGRRTLLVGFASVILLVMTFSVLNRSEPTDDTDAPVMVADSAVRDLNGSVATGPRYMVPGLGSAARWHLPAIFDEPALPRTQWPPAIGAIASETVELRRAAPGSDTYFVGLDLELLRICLFIAHDSLAPEDVLGSSGAGTSRQIQREAGAASSCIPLAEFAIDRAFSGPSTLCCGTFGLVPRNISEVGMLQFALQTDLDGFRWLPTPLGIVLVAGDDFMLDGVAFRLVDGTYIGPTLNARYVPAPISNTSASLTLDGQPVANRTADAFNDGTAQCARLDDRIQVSTTFYSSDSPRPLRVTFVSQVDGSGGSTQIRSVGVLPDAATVVPPVAIIEGETVGLYTSSRSEEGLYEISVDCGLDYFDARSAPLQSEGQLGQSAIEPGPGTVIGQLAIDAIDVDTVLIEGVDENALRKGPGHYPSSPVPGEAGNVGIAGLRTTFGAPFHRLDELQAGDAVRIRVGERWFWYRVVDQGDGATFRIVAPEDVSVLEDFGDNRLTLTSTSPAYGNSERIVVVAELIGPPAGQE